MQVKKIIEQTVIKKFSNNETKYHPHDQPTDGGLVLVLELDKVLGLLLLLGQGGHNVTKLLLQDLLVLAVQGGTDHSKRF